MDKEDVVYIHTHTPTHTMEYYSAIKKNEIFPFATIWMDLEGIMLSEVRQRTTYLKVYVFTYMWNLKNKWMSITKQKQTHRYREQTSGYQWEEGPGEVLMGKGIKRAKLLRIK